MRYKSKLNIKLVVFLLSVGVIFLYTTNICNAKESARAEIEITIPQIVYTDTGSNELSYISVRMTANINENIEGVGYFVIIEYKDKLPINEEIAYMCDNDMLKWATKPQNPITAAVLLWQDKWNQIGDLKIHYTNNVMRANGIKFIEYIISQESRAKLNDKLYEAYRTKNDQ